MTDDEIAKRRKWFDAYMRCLETATVALHQEGVFHTCPACGYPTLSERGAYEICLLCDWEDDGQDDPNADEVWGGPNGDYSLSEARENFKRHLTMYRLDDKRAFEEHTKKAAIKRELIIAYDRMINAKNSDENETIEDHIRKLERLL